MNIDNLAHKLPEHFNCLHDCTDEGRVCLLHLRASERKRESRAQGTTERTKGRHTLQKSRPNQIIRNSRSLSFSHFFRSVRKRHNDGSLQGRFVTWRGVKIRVPHIRAGCGCQLMGAERGLMEGGGDLVLRYTVHA